MIARLLCFLAGILAFVAAHPAAAQTGEWAWMGGNDTLLSSAGRSTLDCNPGVYGTLNQPAASNLPGGRLGAVSWTDKSGHLWLFGGDGCDEDDAEVLLNDLWEYDPATKEWTWRAGSSTVPIVSVTNNGAPGIYGNLGSPASGNTPGGRSGAAG